MELIQAIYLLHGWLNYLSKPVKAEIRGHEFFNLQTGKRIKMPRSLQNDAISVLHVTFVNLSGQEVPAPPGGTTTVSLVDATGAPSTFGTAQVGSPDGTGMDGTKVSVIPNAGNPLGDVYVKYDDTGSTAGTDDDISFNYWCTFTADMTAVSATVDEATIEIFPLPAAPAPSAA